MGELLARSWPFLLPALLPIVALLHVPLAGRRGRTVWAVLLGLVAVGFFADVLIFDHSGNGETLRVPTLFGQGDEASPTVMFVEEVTAPAWQWHVVVIVYFGAIAAWSWLLRGRPSAAPRPVPIAFVAFAWVLAARLALEKTGAPVGIVWATGVSPASFVIACFFGWYCGRRGFGFGRYALHLLLANALQRALLVAVGWFATTKALGTHLDTHTIHEIVVPVRGRIELGDPVAAWISTLLIPQMTFALVLTFASGIVVGVLPWLLARRRAARPAAATA